MVSSLWVWVCVVSGMRRRGERTRPADSCALRHRLVRLATLDVGVEVAGAARHAVDLDHPVTEVRRQRVLMNARSDRVSRAVEIKPPTDGLNNAGAVAHDPVAVRPDRVGPAARLTDFPGADHFLAIFPHGFLPTTSGSPQ